jgi:hypothetical protein
MKEREQMRTFVLAVTVLCFWIPFALAQSADSNANSSDTSCTFDDGQQVSVRYNSSAKSEDMRNGKAWRPGNAAMTLFTQTALTINKVDVAPGAYSLWIIPDKKSWSLAVNKNVTEGAAYDEGQDLVRTPMDLGQLGSPVKDPEVGFAHVAPKECNLRVYFGKTGAFGEIYEK